MDEPDKFIYPGINNPDQMFENSGSGLWFPKRKNKITILPDFNAKYFRLLTLRFTVDNVISVTIKLFRKNHIIEQMVRDIYFHTFHIY